ncbi:hypothetical protein RKD18_002034 [Streptomyces phaeoluteigriseus]
MEDRNAKDVFGMTDLLMYAVDGRAEKLDPLGPVT